MNKRYFMIIAITIVISSVIAYYYLFHTDSIREKEMDETDFLKDKVAVVYYSTTIDTRPGKGFAVFIDQKGEAYPFETKGLELGSSAFNGKTVFFQDETNDYTLSTELKKEKRDKPQFTGDYIGENPKDNSFFSIFNTGFAETGEGYESDIYWKHNQQHKKDTLPFFIETRGHHKNNIYTISGDVTMDEKDDNESYTFALHKTTLSAEAKTVEIMSWNDSDEPLPLSHMHYFNKHLYYLDTVSRKEKSEFRMVDLDLKNKQVDYQIIFETALKETDDFLPHSVHKNAHIDKDKFYMIDGKGNVYSTDLRTGSSKKEFHIKTEFQPHDFVEVDWRDHYLYLYFNTTDKSALETYDLTSGERIDRLEIKGVEAILKKNKVYSYDLLILK